MLSRPIRRCFLPIVSDMTWGTSIEPAGRAKDCNGSFGVHIDALVAQMIVFVLYFGQHQSFSLLEAEATIPAKHVSNYKCS